MFCDVFNCSTIPTPPQFVELWVILVQSSLRSSLEKPISAQWPVSHEGPRSLAPGGEALLQLKMGKNRIDLKKPKNKEVAQAAYYAFLYMASWITSDNKLSHENQSSKHLKTAGLVHPNDLLRSKPAWALASAGFHAPGRGSKRSEGDWKSFLWEETGKTTVNHSKPDGKDKHRLK